MSDYKISVKGVVVKDGKFLVLKQATPIGHLWTLPGGRVEPGETPRETLGREIAEEVGCKITVVGPLGYYWSTRTIHKGWVCCITFLCKISPGEIDITKNPDVGKVIGYAWVTKEEFLSDEYRVAEGTIKNFIQEET